ncbi:enoyl-CoA hydratase [Rhizobium sp. SG_E_25_P2]|uniref:enoyl-CoA hydratase/isomerase family protein n=1 Tax=Rhizobium sp. SG_E_25_P2 TaxID=2879942 RepID=UPI002475A672|nr:enoyl-CoA hydratase/isomerase family protein [Rhizobium sp. SG_E_25_P2]MDH6265156.1 enoyl-CoA hydratase [Rhizobium sp. SG_E_25_P2]
MNNDVLFDIEGGVGRISLNRPDTLNAINEAIVDAIDGALRTWRDQVDVAWVMLEGRGDKALCAGGDLASLYAMGRAGDFDRASAFWRREYRLNALIARYPKPYVAIMHGFVMGGGVGLSAHGTVRIAADNCKISMPECSVGLMPDVGGTLLLARAPGFVGEFLGLTGHRMSAADAVYAGFADIVVSAEDIPALKALMIATGDVGAAREMSTQPGSSQLQQHRAEIDAVFAAPDLTSVLDRLAVMSGDWASATREAIGRGSPLSLRATFEAIRRARSTSDIRAALRTEYRFVSRAMRHGDFLEGIRALIIDKDRKPVWRHPTIASVPDELVQTMLSAPDGGDLEFSTEEVGQ